MQQPIKGKWGGGVGTGGQRSGALGLTGLAVAMLLPSIGSSMILTTMPIFMRTFGAPYGEIQWLSAAFFAMLCIFALPAGRLGDRIGRKRALMGGIIIFALCSIACVAAQNLMTILLLRIGQGIGGAAILVLIFALAADLPEGRARSIAIGVLNGAQAFGTTAGPPIAGFILAWLGWRWLFMAMAILAVAAGLLIRTSLAESRGVVQEKSAEALMGRGAELLPTVSIAVVIVGLMTIAHDWRAAAVIVAGGLLMAATALWRSRSRQSLGAISLVHLLGTGGMLMVMSTTLTAGSFLLSRSLRLDPVQAGLCLAFAPLTVVLAAVPVERMVRRMGMRRASWGMMAVFGAGIAILAFAPGPALTTYLAGMFVVAIGYAGFQTAGTIAVMSEAAPAQRGFAASSISLARNMGMICGTSLLGQIFVWLVQRRASGATGMMEGAAISGGFHQLFVANVAIVALLVAILWFVTRQPGRNTGPGFV